MRATLAIPARSSGLRVSIVRENGRQEMSGRNIGEENAPEGSDGLTLSASPRPAIRLEPGFQTAGRSAGLQRSIDEEAYAGRADWPYAQVNWLSRPLSGRTLAWLVDSLIVIAGLLLFALIFLSIAHELPPWPLTLGTASAAAVFVAATYWAVFAVFGGPSLGARLAQAASSLEEEETEERAASARAPQRLKASVFIGSERHG